ncbi:DUF2298 domain-containing protein [Methanospirillum stamsii]|uniref:YYY membrane protein n=1 Tax=Methanospirillum stamsii TaxID=1277351 RepID=A0A2V2N5G2_9EURY|nr:DUF2298 domain-containing protein [Methanospirillum stamsii]PWR70751.1 hypothetical protein DLD82_14725 [Methanospirillum stamsii]
MIEVDQVFAVLSWFVVLVAIHLSLYPWIKKILPKVAVPVSGTGGFILFSLGSWYSVYLGFSPLMGLVPVMLLYIGVMVLKLGHFYLEIPKEWRYYLLFIVVFAAFLVVRMFNPDINGAEKFMDHGFLASILRNPMVPPLDPWFAGGELNVYYYFGHWMVAMPAFIAGIPSNLLFNLVLPTIAALSALNLYGAGNVVLKHVRILPVLAFFIVNPYFIFLALTGTASFTLLWDSSRVILNTINEYPLFSFLFGDVHAHVLGILPQTFLVLMVTIALTCWKSVTRTGRGVIILLTSLGLSIIPAVNSWDILIWAPMILAVGFCMIIGENAWDSIRYRPLLIINQVREELFRKKGGWMSSEASAIIYLLLVPVVSLLLISPLLFSMCTQGIEGIGFVHNPSHIMEFLMVHSWFLLAFLFSFRSLIKTVPWVILVLIPFFVVGYLSAGFAVLFLILLFLRRNGAADFLATGGLVILLFCEIFYLADNMGETYYRMNTVFKLYIGAWILCGTSAGLMIGKELDQMIENSNRWRAGAVQYGIVLLLCLCLVVPPMVVSTIPGAHTPTLDGLAWLSSSNQGDAEAVNFLRSLPGNHIIVEAAGDDYQYTSRISSFTGIPTIIGWQFHEYMWRGNTPDGWYSQRGSDVRTMYENPEQTTLLMRSYNASLLYVGPEENKKYTVSICPDDFHVLYKNHDVTIYQLNSL